MTVCLFLGPTLDHARAHALLPDAVILPPVEHGAVYAAVKARGATVLGIVDGYFLHRPSVWHKEILWALDRGVSVYGAASMGALRAAELEAFGMIGVGQVFRRFADGALPPFAGPCDDDEVAVVHGPPETGYLAVSDAMVDMRATFEAAGHEGVVEQTVVNALCDIAKGLHFSKRAYAVVLELARNAVVAGVDVESLERLEAWLPTGRVRQKRADALELLERIARQTPRSARESPDEPVDRRAFRFEVTEIWNEALPNMLAAHRPASHDEDLRTRVLDELRLTPDGYVDAKRAAMARLEPGIGPSPERYDEDDPVETRAQLRRVADALRRRHALLDRAAIDDWLGANDLSEEELDELIRREAAYERRTRVPDTPEIASAILDHLRLTGDYPSLAARASAKRQALDGALAAVPPGDELLRWHFERMRGELVPVDIDGFARGLGLANVAELVRLLADEHRFLAL